MTLPTSANAPLRLVVAYTTYFPDTPATHVFQLESRDIWVMAAQNDSYQYCVAAPDLHDGFTTFSLQSVKTRRTVMQRPLPMWARYFGGVALVLGQQMDDAPGFVAALAGDEAAGPRYQFALGMAFAALWCELAHIPHSAETLVEIVDRARREYVEV